MLNRKSWAIGLATIALALASPAGAQTDEQLETLLREMEAMRAEQQAIRQDLAEVRKLLESGAAPRPERERRGRPPFKPTALEVGDSFVMGESTAPVTMFSFSDYHCPFCRRHALNVLPELIKNQVETGNLRIVMREMPIARLHPRAPAAAQAALCAGKQDQYLPMHDLLFAQRKNHTDEDLQEMGRTLGLDTGAFEACLDDPEVAATIQAEIQEGRSMNISGTPAFVFGATNPDNPEVVQVTGIVPGAAPLRSFESAIAGALEPEEPAGENTGES